MAEGDKVHILIGDLEFVGHVPEGRGDPRGAWTWAGQPMPGVQKVTIELAVGRAPVVQMDNVIIPKRMIKPAADQAGVGKPLEEMLVGPRDTGKDPYRPRQGG
jgi:hypothetical protein